MGIFGGNSSGNNAANYGLMINALNTQAAYDNLNKWHGVARDDLTAHNYYQPFYDQGTGSLSIS